MDDTDELAGLGALVAQLSAAARREGVAMATGQPTPELVEATDKLALRIMRRVRRLELLGDMGGIEPSDVRAALVGTWRN